MLTLQRTEGESIVMEIPPSTTPTRISVMLVRVKSSQSARIGIVAPDAVRIDREEIRKAKDAALVQQEGKRQ